MTVPGKGGHLRLGDEAKVDARDYVDSKLAEFGWLM